MENQIRKLLVLILLTNAILLTSATKPATELKCYFCEMCSPQTLVRRLQSSEGLIDCKSLTRDKSACYHIRYPRPLEGEVFDIGCSNQFKCQQVFQVFSFSDFYKPICDTCFESYCNEAVKLYNIQLPPGYYAYRDDMDVSKHERTRRPRPANDWGPSGSGKGGSGKGGSGSGGSGSGGSGSGGSGSGGSGSGGPGSGGSSGSDYNSDYEYNNDTGKQPYNSSHPFGPEDCPGCITASSQKTIPSSYVISLVFLRLLYYYCRKSYRKMYLVS